MIIRVLFLADEVDSSFGRLVIEVNLESFKGLQVYQAPVAMVWGEVEVSEEVCADYWLFDVGNGKIKWVLLATQGDSKSDAAVTGDRSSVGGGEFGPVRTFFALGRARRYDGEHCPSVDKPFEF